MRDWPALALHFPSGTDSSLQDLVVAALDADDVAAIEERSPEVWLVSFCEAAARDAAAAVLRTAWAQAGVTVEPVQVPDDDWARRSQAGLGSVRIGRVVVAPPWCAASPDEPPETIRLIIEPSMGFGSGHHATTRLCLDALQSLDLAGVRVLDIGTGSGILAIAAARLGASSVLGVDNDVDALGAARAGATANGPLPSLTFRESDFRSAPPGQADVVLANLTGSMLATSAPAVAACVVPGGHLILSGITTAEAQAVLDVYLPAAALRWRRDEDGWVGLVLQTRNEA